MSAKSMGRRMCKRQAGTMLLSSRPSADEIYAPARTHVHPAEHPFIVSVRCTSRRYRCLHSLSSTTVGSRGLCAAWECFWASSKVSPLDHADMSCKIKCIVHRISPPEYGKDKELWRWKDIGWRISTVHGMSTRTDHCHRHHRQSKHIMSSSSLLSLATFTQRYLAACGQI